LAWEDLDDLEERPQSHQRDTCLDVKPYYTPSELGLCQGDLNSQKPKNEAAKDKEERVIGPGPTLVRDLYAKQPALNISFNQQPARSSIAFIALAFLCVFVFAGACCLLTPLRPAACEQARRRHPRTSLTWQLHALA
jgi:hypothetical protein